MHKFLLWLITCLSNRGCTLHITSTFIKCNCRWRNTQNVHTRFINITEIRIRTSSWHITNSKCSVLRVHCCIQIGITAACWHIGRCKCLYCDVSWQNFVCTAGFNAELQKDVDMWVTVNILYHNVSRQTSYVLLIHTASQYVSSFFLQALYTYGDQCVV